MKKQKYIAHVRVEGELEEVVFERTADAPSIPAHYAREKKSHGKYKDGKVYSLDPDAVNAELEEERAEDEIEQTREMVKDMAAPDSKSGAKKAKK